MSGKTGSIQTHYTTRGLFRGYSVEVSHKELNKYRVIKGTDVNFIQRQAEVQLADWEEQYSRRRAVIARGQHQSGQKERAAQKTEEAARLHADLQTLLQNSLAKNSAVDWERLKDHSKFSKPRPAKPAPLPAPSPIAVPREPLPIDPAYQPQLGFLDKILAARREQKEAVSSALSRHNHIAWEKQKVAIESENSKRVSEHQQRIKSQEAGHEKAVRAWEKEKAAYHDGQRLRNEAVDEQWRTYLTGDAQAVRDYCDMVLSASEYPTFFPQEYELDYQPDARILLLDYWLPAPEVVPTLSEVRYVAAQDKLTEKHISQTQLAKIYDEMLYQVVLRTVHELFEADVAERIDAIGFNGYVRSTDKATGKEITPCVLSLQVKKEEFQAIHLAAIDPKICFKQLKGVGSSKLHSVTPVAPIVQLRREDARFVSSYDVADGLDESINLAAMDWEDFEHLIREIFGKEFSSHGGEVKVTQASRDGGVDAVAFDPDPIRGGKIVIQAKRYTNTVGVGAVRDLYGTMMSEGANKGILVTTSDYGPDAYQFANGKPLTLLSGSNLLHLLEKHGHQAKIDLAEAKKMAVQNARSY